LFRIFNTIDYDSDEEWFTQPKDCDTRMVCSETGLLPGDHCANLVMDHFIPLISSTVKCNNIQEVLVSADEKMSYCKNCVPQAGYKKKIFKVTEPEMQAWFEDHKIAYQKIPPHNPGCETIFKGNAPTITSPSNGSEYLISKKSKEPLQLTCKAGTDVNKVYWYINNRYYKTAHSKEKIFFMPGAGQNKISCTDDKGRNRDIRITVNFVNL